MGKLSAGRRGVERSKFRIATDERRQSGQNTTLLVGADNAYDVFEETEQFRHLIERFRDDPARYWRAKTRRSFGRRYQYSTVKKTRQTTAAASTATPKKPSSK